MIKLAELTSTYRANLVAKSYQGEINKSDKVLDIGCGTGIVADKISNIFGCLISGCDIENYLLKKIRFREMKDIKKIPFKKNEFDVSMFNDVLHHISYSTQKQIIKEAMRVSRKLLIFEMNPQLTGKLIDLVINKIHNPNMQILYTYRSFQEWRKLINTAGFSVKLLRYEKPILYPIEHIVMKVYNSVQENNV